MSKSIAPSSRRTFGPGVTVYKEFCNLHDIDCMQPSSNDITLFATHLSHSKSLSTINVYLASVRYFLLCNDRPTEHLRSVRLSAVLRGIERTQAVAPQRRVALTVEDLKKFRQYLNRSNYNQADRAMLWAGVTVSFFGLLRSCELLAPEESQIDSESTLLWRHVTLGPVQIRLQLRRTKTHQSGDGGQVLLHRAADDLCPVEALNHFASLCRQTATLQPSTPVFKFASGKFLTRKLLTDILRFSLQSTSLSSHSLRIGGATHMAARGAGEWAIKRAGRWRSSAFNRYVRCPAGMPAQH